MDQFNRMLARWEPMVLSIFRIMVGVLLFQYGVAKLFKFPPVPMFEKVELMSLYGAAGTIELIFGGLLILGLFTRPVAFILCGEMAFAYFMGHMFKAGIGAPVFIPLLSGGNAAILFCFACLYLACAGGGLWSVDAMMRKRA
jgi:putative oxidoreductase